MSLFIFSLLAGLLLHQIVSVIQPKDDSSEYRCGRRIVIKFEEGAYLIWKAGSLALAIILFVGVVTIIVTRGVHPSDGYAYGFADALTSPRMAAAVFGGLVGFLIGNLLNRILKNGDDYEFKASDRLEMLLIFLLVILGIGGEEWLKSAAQRINKISVGTTTEIAFSETRPKASRAAAEQPNSARRTTTDEGSSPAGLGKLADLKDNILGDEERKYKSDAEFMGILAWYERVPAPNVDQPGILPTQVLGPIGKCLSAIFAYNGDTAFIQQRLIPLSEILRDLVEPPYPAAVAPQKTDDQSPNGGNANDGQAAKENMPWVKLQQQVQEIAIYATARDTKLKTTGEKPEDPCKDVNKIAKKANIININKASFDQFRNSSSTLPYAAMAFASVMAALHHYEAASIAMFKWIEEHKDPKFEKKEEMVKAQWSLLRARFAQGSFIEEWIRVRGPAASSSLRQYHIDNLKAIFDDMKSFAAIREMSQKNSDYELKPGLFGAFHSEDDGECVMSDIPKSATKLGGPANEDERYTLGKLYESYLSAKNDYVDQALKHPIVKVKSATKIGEEAADLIKHNLRCVEQSRRKLIRAGHIDRFVRSEINLMDNLAPLKSSDEIRNRIRETQQKLAFAFQLVEGEATQKRSKQASATTLQSRLQPDQIVEVYETLFATQDQLRDFSEREVTP